MYLKEIKEKYICTAGQLKQALVSFEDRSLSVSLELDGHLLLLQRYLS